MNKECRMNQSARDQEGMADKIRIRVPTGTDPSLHRFMLLNCPDNLPVDSGAPAEAECTDDLQKNCGFSGKYLESDWILTTKTRSEENKNPIHSGPVIRTTHTASGEEPGPGRAPGNP